MKFIQVDFHPVMDFHPGGLSSSDEVHPGGLSFHTGGLSFHTYDRNWAGNFPLRRDVVIKRDHTAWQWQPLQSQLLLLAESHNY